MIKLLALLIFVVSSFSFAQDSSHKVFLQLNITPMNESWFLDDLGDKSIFHKSLEKAWKKWIGEQKIFADNVEILSEEENLSHEDLDYLLKVELNLWKKMLEDEVYYHWDGRVVLIDKKTNDEVFLSKVSVNKKKKAEIKQDELKSVIASLIYKSTQPSFFQFKSELKQKKLVHESFVRLKINGFQKLPEALELIQILEKKGVALKLRSKLDSFTTNEAYFLLYFQGEEKYFQDVLSSLTALKSFLGYNLVNQSKDAEYALGLISK